MYIFNIKSISVINCEDIENSFIKDLPNFNNTKNWKLKDLEIKGLDKRVAIQNISLNDNENSKYLITLIYDIDSNIDYNVYNWKIDTIKKINI